MQTLNKQYIPVLTVKKQQENQCEYLLDIPRNPWQRLYIDYAGPYRGTIWLLLIDAYSK